MSPGHPKEEICWPVGERVVSPRELDWAPEAMIVSFLQTTSLWLSGSCSVAQSCPTLCDPWTAAHQASLSITNSRFSISQRSFSLYEDSYMLVLSGVEFFVNVPKKLRKMMYLVFIYYLYV